MAYLAELKDEVRIDLANQIGEFIDYGALHLESTQKLQLEEAFPMWILPASIEFNTYPIYLEFKQTEYWHFQIYNEEAAVAHARCKINDNERPKLSAVLKSELSPNIYNAISIIDQSELEGEVRLLEAPAWLITSLWVYEQPNDNSNFIIVNRPANLDIPLLRVMDENEFTEIFRGLSSIEGRISELIRV